MRPTIFDASILRRHLRRHKIPELPELKHLLGTETDLTVFRKLRQLGYLASYTHRGRFYTLSECVGFDDRGLWSHDAVWFSRYGTLLATAEDFVLASSRGFYAHELADAVHAEVQEPLHHLVRLRRLSRADVDARPFRWQFNPGRFRFRQTSSRPRSFCFMACSMSNSPRPTGVLFRSVPRECLPASPQSSYNAPRQPDS